MSKLVLTISQPDMQDVEDVGFVECKLSAPDHSLDGLRDLEADGLFDLLENYLKQTPQQERLLSYWEDILQPVKTSC